MVHIGWQCRLLHTQWIMPWLISVHARMSMKTLNFILNESACSDRECYNEVSGARFGISYSATMTSARHRWLLRWLERTVVNPIRRATFSFCWSRWIPKSIVRPKVLAHCRQIRLDYWHVSSISCPWQLVTHVESALRPVSHASCSNTSADGLSLGSSCISFADELPILLRDFLRRSHLEGRSLLYWFSDNYERIKSIVISKACIA